MPFMRWFRRRPLDNLDVDVSQITSGKWGERKDISRRYRDWTLERARRNLELVRSGKAHESYGLAEPIHVWHINSFLHTLPSLASALSACQVEPIESGLDVGCGTVTFFEFFEIAEAELIDLSPEYVEFQGQKGWSASVADVEDLSFADSSFDLVVASDILEHVMSFDRALSEISRVLKKKGYLAVNVPWEQDLGAMSTGIQLGSHIRRFDSHNLVRRFEGFELIHQEILPAAKGKPSRIQTSNLIFTKI